MDSVIDGLESTALSGRNDALNRAAWTLGRWIAAGALEQGDVEDELYAAAEHNGLVGDDGESPVLGHDPKRSQRRPAAADRPGYATAVTDRPGECFYFRAVNCE
jgi:hypothetical protein